jgi:lysophospholipase L1-like esterase
MAVPDPDSPADGSRLLVLVGSWLVLLAILAGCGSDRPVGADAAKAATTTTSTTTTTVATTTVAPTTTTTPPPPPPPPPTTVDPALARAQATAAALQFLSAAEAAEVSRLCNAAQLNVRVDHPGATMRVGVVGDSLTVQTIDQLTADTRFNWTVTAMCGARGDHYLGTELLGGSLNLRGAFDDVVRDEPDVLLIALGTNDVLNEVFTNVPMNLTPGIEGLLGASESVPCRSWVNVHTPVRPGVPYGPEFRWDHYAPHYNRTIDAYVAAEWTDLSDWDAVLRSSGPDQLLMSDGIHLSPGGRAARTQLLGDTAANLAGSCVQRDP